MVIYDIYLKLIMLYHFKTEVTRANTANGGCLSEQTSSSSKLTMP